jgi:RNA-directed DNA polymerase
MAALLILEPDPGIDLRIGLSGLLVRVPAMAEYASGAGGDQRALQEGYQAVYDADLKSYCDTISHEKLLACLRHRMADRSVLGLIRMWLEAVVVEEGENGSGEKRTRNEKGTP